MIRDTLEEKGDHISVTKCHIGKWVLKLAQKCVILPLEFIFFHQVATLVRAKRLED